MSNRTLVLNDLHLGVQRAGGTTWATAAELRDYALQQYKRLLRLAVPKGIKRIVVNGDLTDTYDTMLAEALKLYAETADFLAQYPDIELVWAVGNHDLSKDSSKLGTVVFIGELLTMQFTNFKLVKRPEMLAHDTYVLPHVTNQDIFDLELSRVPESAKWVFLHCNYDNTFACAADHSLNISREQAKALRKHAKIVIGHEHQGRELMSGNVIIVGNQFPTSVADCLPHGDAQADGTKHALVLDHDTGEHSYITTWTPDDADGWFAALDWRELADVVEEGRGFIRVEGEALLSESADAIKAIAAFRAKSKSFVITNAVKVEKAEGLDSVAESIEDIRSTNVIELLLEYLTPEQQQVVRDLREGATE
jgi:hypothetical protein